ncbi:MAG: hypothetical protein NT167_25655 [Verrucomicrobia bacterium]|nr:hypothetical protein [Verrucomicrobiota bacterium]
MSNILQEPAPIEVSHLGNFEARLLRKDDGPAGQQHRQWVTELLSWGRLVQRATQQPEFPDKALASRVDARVRHLEDKLSLWHGDMPSAEQDRILQAAFK